MTLEESREIIPLMESMIGPVSYTHLDVYKRQVQLHPAVLVLYEAFRPQHMAARGVGEEGRDILFELLAREDVYKRQVWYNRTTP